MAESQAIRIGEPSTNLYQEIAHLYNYTNSRDYKNHIRVDARYFRRSYSIPGFNPSKDMLQIRDDSDKLIAFGTIASPKDIPVVSVRITLFVHPEVRDNGTGAILLEKMNEEARIRGAHQITWRIPSYQKYEGALALNSLFHPVRDWVNVKIDDLLTIKPKVHPSELIIRSMNPREDIPLLVSLQNESLSGTADYVNITNEYGAWLIEQEEYTSELTLLAAVNDEYMGYVIGCVSGTSDNPLEKRTLQIQGFGVISGYRREEYESAILQHVLIRASKLGLRSSELLLDSDNTSTIKTCMDIGYTERFLNTLYIKTI
ncbi:MAG: GNAT family N-acetyltransferase [Candidatus Thorarchaeota archaeon]